MSAEEFEMIVICIITAIIMLFLSGVEIRRSEKCVSRFYYALREKYPRNYVNQNKIIKRIRTIYKMNTNITIHWMYCIFHYIQIIALILPVLLVVLMLILPSFSLKKALFIYFRLSIYHFALISLLEKVLRCIECSKCKKIKKENPKYAKIDFYYF